MTKSLKQLYAGFRTFKRANRGLYGESIIRFGETVSEHGNRTKRSFKPNIQYCTFYSESLGKKIQIRSAVHVIRKIDDQGGLDNYILNQKFPESWFADKLKYEILMAKHNRELKSRSSENEEMFNAA